MYQITIFFIEIELCNQSPVLERLEYTLCCRATCLFLNTPI